MKKKFAIIVVMVLSIVLAFPSVVSAGYDYGYITLDDGTTSLHFYDAGPSYDAHVPTDATVHDYWDLAIATSCDAVVEIEWFDWYPTNDVYELYIDNDYKGTNAAGQHGTWQDILQTGGTYTIEVRWIYYQTNRAPIAGGSYYDITFTVIDQICTIPVDVDIKPGSDPNSINLGDKGVLPVAILGSEDFDVTTIDASTIEIGGITLASRGSAKAPKLAYSYEYVNEDGYMDLVAFFRVQELVEDEVLTDMTTELVLTAETSGVPISGIDSVRVVPPE